MKRLLRSGLLVLPALLAPAVRSPPRPPRTVPAPVATAPTPLILDGVTYRPKYAPCPNYKLWDYRWHPSRAHAHEQINVDQSGTELMWYDVEACRKTRSWSLPVAADYGIGSGEGNPSNDGRFVLIAGTTQIYVVDMH